MTNSLLKDTMADMKCTDIEESVKKQALVLLPLGVIEEHGPHLCLGTDIYTAHIQCLYLKDILAEKGYEAIIAPPLYWGICQSTGSFIGSFKIRKETFKALIVDIITSLSEFGFKNVYGINAHGDIEQSIAIIDAFKEAGEKLPINARYAFDEWRLQPFGLSGSEPYLCPIGPQSISASNSKYPDVHAGDIETATMNKFYPELTDGEKARTLPPVAINGDKIMTWLFGGHTAEISPDGYLGSPADFEGVDALNNIKDIANRISDAIISHIL